MNSKKIITIAMNVSLLSVLSQITIPLQPIPFTLQMFGIYLISFLYSPKISLYTLIVYLLMGFLGLPVFTGFKGGFSTFLSPTIGFIFAFPLVSLINAKSHRSLGFILSFILSSLVLYTFGIIGLRFILKHVYQSPIALSTSIYKYALVFIPSDALSYIFSLKLSRKLNNKIYSL